MRRLLIVFTTAMLMCLLVGLSQSVFADDDSEDTEDTKVNVRVENATIPWVFPPPDGLSSFCSKIPEGVHINPDDNGSNRVKEAIRNKNSDGTLTIVIKDVVKGTARDGDNVTYEFLYENKATYDFDGKKVKVNMLDNFELKGGKVKYTVGFHWRWEYLTNSFKLIRDKDENGKKINVRISPEFFATNDGKHDDPNIIPGSWKKLDTKGDPFNCDPL